MTDSRQSGDETGPSVVRTITDLARVAGVSPGTVSRALANNTLVNAKTRERIQKLASEHGFQLNRIASNLRKKKTGVIGVAIPLGHDMAQQLSDTFFMTLLGHLADELTAMGYDLMLRRVLPQTDPDWLDRFIGSGMIDGLIIIGQSDQFSIIEEVAEDYSSMVVWGNHQEGQRHCVVGTDNTLGGRLAAQQLVAAGCSSLAFFGDTSAAEFAARFAGAKLVADEKAVPIASFPAHLAQESMQGELSSLLENCPDKFDGIFAASDGLAAECLRILSSRKVAIPRDVKIVGYDDLPIAAQVHPAITTIRQDLAAGAKAMVDLLTNRIGGAKSASVVMQPELVIRDTA